MPSPIALFVYNRPGHTRRTVEALQMNEGAPESDLFIYSDGPRPGQEEKVAQVRAYLKTVAGFKSITIVERDRNWGLADSIIAGVSEVIENRGRVIVLEDDLITTRYFLRFMNDALDVYTDAKNVYAVTGYMFPIGSREKRSVLLPYISTWGWATWRDRWAAFENEIGSQSIILRNKWIAQRFNLADYDYVSMLNISAARSWGIRWYYTVFIRNGLSVFPTVSLVRNIGFDGSGENCNAMSAAGPLLSEDPVSVRRDDGMDIKYLEKYLDYFSIAKKEARSMGIVRLLKKIKMFLKGRGRSIRPNFLSFCEIGLDSEVSGMQVEVRRPDRSRIFLRIGDGAVVSGNFVFENSEGFIDIGDQTFIGKSLFISVDRISIGKNVLVSWGCTLMDTDAHSVFPDARKGDVSDWKRGVMEGKLGKYKNWEQVKHAPIVIEDDVWIGFNSIILKGVTIGRGAVVGAGSVVTKDVPPFAVVVGNPARVVRQMEKRDA